MFICRLDAPPIQLMHSNPIQAINKRLHHEYENHPTAPPCVSGSIHERQAGDVSMPDHPFKAACSVPEGDMSEKSVKYHSENVYT